MTKSVPPLLLDRQALARVLSCSPYTITWKLKRGLIPRPFQIGGKGKLLWREVDIRLWLEREARTVHFPKPLQGRAAQLFENRAGRKRERVRVRVKAMG